MAETIICTTLPDVGTEMTSRLGHLTSSAEDGAGRERAAQASSTNDTDR